MEKRKKERLPLLLKTIRNKAPAKEVKKGGMEEIDDPVPTVVKFSKNYEDNPLKMTEEVAQKWSEFVMKIDIFEYDREAGEDKLVDSIEIDLSFFLFPKEEITEAWEFEHLKPYPINYLKVNISTNTSLLSEFLRKKLNPLQIFILAAKDVPFKTEPKYLPVYTVCRFVDGQVLKTRGLPQADL